MNNVISLPRKLPQYTCGECESEVFILCEDESGKLVAVCFNCQCPTVQIGCGCLDIS